MQARVRAIVGWVLSRLIGALVLGLVTLAFLQVVLRYAFAASILWVEEVSVMALIWLAWLGIVHLWMFRSHIAVDLLAASLGRAGRRRLAAFIDGLALIGGLALFVVSFETLEIYSGMDLGSLDMDASVKYIPVSIGGAGLALAGLLNLWAAADNRETRS